MPARHSTNCISQGKPDRPEGSLNFWYATGRRAKKIRGKLHDFGRGSHAEALAEYDQQKADLHAGRTPCEDAEGLTRRSSC